MFLYYYLLATVFLQNASHWLFNCRLQLIHFLIAFIFTWVPLDLQLRWSLSSVCSDREGGVGGHQIQPQADVSGLSHSRAIRRWHPPLNRWHFTDGANPSILSSICLRFSIHQLAYWSRRNAWARASCFLLLKMDIVSPLDSSVNIGCWGPQSVLSRSGWRWGGDFVIRKHFPSPCCCSLSYSGYRVIKRSTTTVQSAPNEA